MKKSVQQILTLLSIVVVLLICNYTNINAATTDNVEIQKNQILKEVTELNNKAQNQQAMLTQLYQQYQLTPTSEILAKFTDAYNNLAETQAKIQQKCVTYQTLLQTSTVTQATTTSGSITGEKILKRGANVNGWAAIQSSSAYFEFPVDDCYQTASGVYVVSKGWVCKMFDGAGNGSYGQYALWGLGLRNSPYSDRQYAPVEGKEFWKLN